MTIAPPLSTATALAVSNTGQVSSLTLTSGGSGYPNGAPPTVTFSGGGTPTTVAQAVATVNNGVVSIVLTNPGAGYTSDPTVTISPPPSLQAAGTAVVGSDGTISAINVNAKGAGYGTTAPNVFLMGGGFTTPARVTANLTGGSISSFTVTAIGSGYTSAPTVFIAPPPTGMTLSGPGTVILPNANDVLTGPSNVNGVNLVMGAGAALGQGTLRLNAGTISGTAPITITNAVTLNNSQLTFTGNNPFVFGSPLAYANAVAQVFNGNIDNLQLKYGGAGYSTPPVVNVLSTGNDAQNATAAAAQAIVQNGTVTGIFLTNAGTGFTQDPKITFTFSSPATTVATTNTNSIVSNNQGGVQFAGVISGAGNLVTAGTSPITFSGVNTYTGLTLITAGTVVDAVAAGLGASGAGQGTVVSPGATLQVTGDRLLNANTSVQATIGEPLTISGNGAGGGALEMPMINAISIPNAINPNYSGSITYSGAITLISDASIGSDGGLFTVSGAISGPGNLTKVGTGTLNVTGGNSFTGQFLIGAGNVWITNASSLGTIAGGTTVADGASLVLNSSSTFVGELLTLSGEGFGQIGANNTLISGPLTTRLSQNPINVFENAGALLQQATNVTWTGNILLNPGSLISVLDGNTNTKFNLTVTGAIGDATPGVHGDLIKGANGNLTLRGPETYTGATTIRYGTVIVDEAGSLLSTSAINILSGGPLGPNSAGNFLAGSLTLDDSTIVTNRVGDATPLNLQGGTFTLLGSTNPGGRSIEKIGPINLLAGTSNIIVQNGAGGLTQLIAPDLVRSPGATVSFFAQTMPNTVGGNLPALGSPLSQVLISSFANNAPLVNGILPWAIVATPGAAPFDWATYSSTNGITAFASPFAPAGQAYAPTLAGAGPNDNVRITASEALTVNKTVNSLIIVGNTANPGNTSVTENGLTLTLGSGAFMAANNVGGGNTTTAILTSGTLNFGPAEGIIFSPFINGGVTNQTVINSNIQGSGGLTIAGVAAQNATSTPSVSGSTITLAADNTYTGTTTLANGILSLGTTGSLGSGTLSINYGAITAATALNIPNPVVLNDSFVYFTGGNAINFTGPVTLTNPLEGTNLIQDFNTSAGGITFSGVVSGPGGITLGGNTSTGAGNTVNFTLTRSNTFSGGFALAGISQGSFGNNPTLPPAVVALTVGNNNALGTGPVLFNSGLIQSSTAVSISNPIRFTNNNLATFDVNDGGGTSGNVYIDAFLLDYFLIFGNGAGSLPPGTPAMTFSGPVSVAGANALYQNTVNATAFTGPISGGGSFDVGNSFSPGGGLTSGPLVFSGDNTFSGGLLAFGGQTSGTTNSVPTTLAIGAGSRTVMSGNNLVSGPFGTGPVTFFNAVLNNTGDGPGTGTAPTVLQTPDDGNTYVLANSLNFGEFRQTSSVLDQTTINVGATNPATTLILTGNAAGTISGTANLIKTGPGTLNVTAPYMASAGVNQVGNLFASGKTIQPIITGSFQVNTGTLALSGAGSYLHQNITVNGGATLTLDNTGLNAPNRISDGVGTGPSLTFNGGTLNYLGAPGAVSTERIGTIQLNAGAATIQSTPGASGGSDVLTATTLTRGTGGTVDFVGIGSPIAPVANGTTAVNQFRFLTPPPTTATNNAGTIGSIAVVSGGAGYSIAPTVTLTGGGGTFTSASATINPQGVVTGVTVIGAKNYTSLPTVTIAPPASTATAAANINLAGVVTDIPVAPGGSGSGYTSVPTVTLVGGGFTLQATAIAKLTNGVVTSIQVTNGGAGYTSAPTVVISPPTATATATSSINISGQLSAVAVDPGNGGAGYSSPPTVTLIGGGFSSPATVVAKLTNGVVTGFTITSPGAGYTTAPLVIIAPPTAAQATAVALLSNPDGFLPYGTVTGTTPGAYDFATYYPGDNGSTGIGAYTGYVSSISAAAAVRVATANSAITGDMVTAVNMSALGAGYTSVPNVTLFGGGGTGATAVATVVGGSITAITVTNGGTAYTSAPTVLIDPPLGDVVKVTGTSDNVVANGATIAGLLLASPTFTTVTLNGSLTVIGGAIAAATGTGAGNTINGAGSIIVPNNVVNAGNSTLAEAYLLANNGSTSNFSPTTGTLASGPAAVTTAGGFVPSPTPNNTNPGTWIITNANTYTGITTVGSGILQVRNSSALGSSPLTGTATISNGTITSVGFPGGVGGYKSAPTVTFTGGGGSNAAATAVITNGFLTAINITNAGTGYTSAPAVAITAPPVTVIGGGSLQTTGTTAMSLSRPLVLNGSGIAGSGALVNTVALGSTWTGNVTLASPTTFVNTSTTNPLTMTTGVISGTGDLIKNGAGGLTLGGADTYTGQTIINAGTLTSSSGTGISTTSPTTVNAGATLAATGVTLSSLLLNGGSTGTTVSGTITLAGNVTSTGTNNQILAAVTNAGSRTITVLPAAVTGNELNISGNLAAAAGSLTKVGGGTLIYSGAGPNAMTGTTTINEGPLLLSKTGVALAGPLVIGNFSVNSGIFDTVKVTNTTNQLNNQNVTINASGTLDTTGAPATINNLTLVGGTLLGPTGANALTLGGSVTATSATTPYGPQSSTISGNVNLGTANHTFSVTDAFVAPVAATAGQVTLSGNAVSAIAVANGGSNYSTPPLVTISGGGGSGASATAVLTNGVVTGFTITGGGTGYTSAPTVTVAAPTPLPTVGGSAVAVLSGATVGSIQLLNGGGGFTSTPVVTLLGGGGTGAQARATISNGVITRIDVSQPGTGYTSPPLVVITPQTLVTATGPAVTLTGNTVTLGTITLPAGTGGSGYTTAPKVSIIGGGGSGATATATINNGAIQSITVTAPGSGYTAPPTVSIASPDLQAQGVAAINAFSNGGTVSSIAVTNGGSGYNYVPTVTLVGGSGTGAAATAVLTGGVVSSITITNGGSGYNLSPPTVVISPPVSPGTLLVPATGAVATFSAASGTVTGITIPGASQGSGYVTPPVVTLTGGGSGATFIPATAVANLTNGVVSGFTLTSPGAGYTSAPTVSIAPPIATGTASINNGGVSSLTVTYGAGGYTFPPLVTFTGGGGTGATATAVVTNGVVTALVLNNPGTGYTSAPTVTIAAPVPTTTVVPASQARATGVVNANGTLGAIVVNNVGSGYAYAPRVTISGGGGSGATAHATIATTIGGVTQNVGVVTGIVIDNPGSGYTSPPLITIDPPSVASLFNVPGLTVTALLSGTGSAGLTKTGTGTLNMNGLVSNTYTGTTFANVGTLLLNNTSGTNAIPAGTSLIIGDFTGGPNSDVVRLGASNEIAPTATIVVNSSGLLDLNNFTNTVGSLAFQGGNVSTGTGSAGTGSITLGGNLTTQVANGYTASITGTGTLNLGGVSRTFSVAGTQNETSPDLVIATPIINDGGGGLVVTGPGSVGAGSIVLTGTSTYTGPTSVNQGTLLVNGALPTTGAVTVANGATLGGTGSVGAVTVSNGGTVAPGAPAGFLPAPNDKGDGTLTAASANFSGGGTLAVQAQSNTTPGATYDRLVVTGTLTVGGTSKFVGDLANSTGTARFGGVATYGTLAGGQFSTASFLNTPTGIGSSVDYLTGANASPKTVDLVVGSLAITRIDLTPPQTTASQVLTATVPLAPISPSGAPVTLTYVWKNGTDIVQTHTTSALSDQLNLATVGHGTAGPAKKGDVITVTITPTDGTIVGAAVTNSITVADALPAATVVITPTGPGTNSILTATATKSDADGDNVQLTYVWTNVTTNKVVQSHTTTALTDTLSLALPGNGDIGDKVSVTVTPNDGQLDGTPVSDQVTVGHGVPTAQVTLTPLSPTTNQVVTANVVTTDPDNLPVTLTYRFLVNGVQVGNDLVTQNASATFDLGAPNQGKKGDVISVVVTPNDQFSAGTPATFQVTVANSPPVTTVKLTPQNPQTNQILTATASTTDDDGDAISYTFVFKKNTVQVGNPIITTSPTVTFDPSAPGNSVIAGDTISVEVTPNDGSQDGLKATASTIVGGSLASIPTLTLSPPSPTTSSVLTATATTADPDNAPVTLTFVWKKNGTTVKTTTTSDPTILTDSLDLGVAGNGDKNDVISVTVTPTALGINGVPNTSSVTVVNSAPTASVKITPTSPTMTDILTATATVNDADTDPVRVSYVWKRGTAVVQTTNLSASLTDTLDLSTLSNLGNNESITVEVTPFDGTTNGAVASDTVKVGDTAPRINTLVLTPPSPGTNSQLTATVTASDPANLPITLTYEWKNGNTPVRTFTTTALSDTLDLSPNGNGNRGDVITVTVTPNNGTQNGTAKSASTTVVNTAPTVSVTLSTSSPTTNQVLTATAVAGDADGDLVTLIYTWSVNGTVVKTTPSTSALTDTLDLSLMGNGDKNQQVSVMVTPYDGTVNGTAATSSATVANSAPVAHGGTESDGHNDATGIDITLAATDDDGDTLTYALVDPSGATALGGHVTLTGKIAHYVPKGGVLGTDTFQWTATDGAATTTPVGTETITLTNAAPIVGPTPSSFNVAQGVPFTATAPGLLQGASDPDGDTFTLGLVTDASHGTVTINQDGTFTYTPATGAAFVGTDTFTYKATDSFGLAGTPATITLNVGIIPPTAANDPGGNNPPYAVSENTTLSVPTAAGVLVNDVSNNGHTLTAVLTGGGGTTHGRLSLASDGSFTYAPDANYTGPDSFTYQAFDGTSLSNTATVSLLVSAFHVPPTASPDTYDNVPKNGVLNIAKPGLLANDSGSGTITAVQPATGGQPSNGTLTLNADGSFTYTPNNGFAGTDSFLYEASDGVAVSTPTLVTIHVVNTAPVAVADTYTIGRNGFPGLSPSVGVLANDTDANHDALTATLGTVQPTRGTLAFNSDGTFTYTPIAGVTGTDTFSYTASDGTDVSSEALVTITITNDAPVASAANFNVGRNGVLIISSPGLLTNVTDANHDTTLGTITFSVAQDVSNGHLTLNSDGTFTYTPNAGYVGPDSFTYHVSDGKDTSNDATVSISVNDTAPVAAAQSYNVNQNGSLALSTKASGLLRGATDADNDVTTVDRITAFPLHGSLTAVDLVNGTFTYTPATGFSGTDTFSYTVTDGNKESLPSVVTITVNPIDIPAASDDFYTTPQGTALTVPSAGIHGLLFNDNDPLNAPLTAVKVSNPANGSVLLNGDGSFTYTPNAGFVGTDTFTYRASNGPNSSNTAVVTISVTPGSQTPTATPPTVTGVPVTATQNSPLVNAVTASFTDSTPGRTPGSFSASINWGDGTATVAGVISFDPASNKFLVSGNHTYAGTGQFTVFTMINDPASNSSQPATSSATVAPAPAPPGSISGARSGNVPVTNVNGTAATSDSTPAYNGQAPSGYVVQLFAQKDGGSPVQVGQVTAQGGTWSITANHLDDGAYTISVKAFNPSAQGSTTQTATIERILIDTQGPKITNIVFDAKHGVFRVTFQDNVGLSAANLMNVADYTLTHGKAGLHPTSAVDITPAGAGTGLRTISLTVGRGKKLAAGKYTLAVDSGLVQDAVGNHLDGEFRGLFPTGNGASGGSFSAGYTVKNNNNRSVKGPVVAASIGAVHPRNVVARKLSAASVHQAGVGHLQGLKVNHHHH